MARRRGWRLLWILIPILVVGIFLSLSVSYLIDPTLYRNLIQKSLTQALGQEVTIGKASITLVGGGVGIAFEDLRVRDRSLDFDLLQSKRLILKAKLLPLLKKEIQWERIILDRPILRVLRDKNGHFNLLKEPSTEKKVRDSEQRLIEILSTLFGGSVTFRNGEVFFSDQSLGESPVVTVIQSFQLQFSEVSFGKAFPFRVSGRVRQSDKEGSFSVKGTIQDIAEDIDLTKGKVMADLEIEEIDVFHFWPYLKQWLPMKSISGTLDLQGHYEGVLLGSFKASARIRFRDVVYDHPEVFAYVLDPKWVNIDFELQKESKEIKISRASLELPEIWVKAKGRIYGIGTKDMGMDAEAQSGPFDLAAGRRLIPYRVIVPDVSDPLFRSQGTGSVQIVSVRLSGKMSEIEHCDELANAHTLSVEMKLNGTHLKFPWNLPAVEDLRGTLLFRDGHLSLKGIVGRVFHSTLEKVSGTFHELLHVPTVQARLEGQFDLGDLAQLAKTDIVPEDVSQALSSIRVDSGRAAYALSLKGVLKAPYRFEHRGVYRFSKSRVSHRQIPLSFLIHEGKLELSQEDLQWSEAAVDFGHSALVLGGAWKYGQKSQAFEISGRGKTDLKDLVSLLGSPVFPEAVRSKTRELGVLSGTGQISFKGRSFPGPPYFSYQGDFTPREASLQPKGTSSPFLFREGTFSLSNAGIAFSKMRVQFLNSTLTLDGSMGEEKVRLSVLGTVNLRELPVLLRLPLIPEQTKAQVEGFQELSGEAEIRLRWSGEMGDWLASLREAEAKLKGIGLQHRSVPLAFSQVEGSLLLTPDQFRFVNLKGKLADSRFVFSGGFPRSVLHKMDSLPTKDAKEPIRWLSFQISSGRLDLDLLFPKEREEAPLSLEKAGEWLSRWNIEAKVEADQVKYQDLFYQDVKAEMKTVDGKLHLYPFQFKSAGGDFWSEGWFWPVEKGIGFDIKPRVSNMEARAFLRIVSKRTREEKIAYTGRLHIDKVELRGEGEDLQQIKESLNGNLRMEMENGVIEKHNVLAKIFSILNVSQLLKGRFPDLATRGLPFRRIVANFQIKDGVASTEDFLVDSDAMRITALGKIDLGKNVIDAKVGVHPLGTVDTVLSKIPIAGYILTGKDKAFLSFVYEVKGDLDDPKIEAIPVKSMGKGFLGIIQRILETPARPFQKIPQKGDEAPNPKHP